MNIEQLRFEHPEIYKRIQELIDTRHTDFSLTSEGIDVWNDVEKGNYYAWYEFWNKMPPKQLIIQSNPRNFFSRNIILSILRIFIYISAFYHVNIAIFGLIILEGINLSFALKHK
jgi:hypothetical protein